MAFLELRQSLVGFGQGATEDLQVMSVVPLSLVATESGMRTMLMTVALEKEVCVLAKEF